MRVNAHVITSLSMVAGVWFFTKSIHAGLLCFIFGVCIDIDHIVEYIVHCGVRGLTPMKVYRVCEQAGRQRRDFIFKRVFLVFHSLEVVILLWAASIYTKNIYVLAVTLGYSGHMIMDSLGNPLRPCSYFLFWRAINNFNTDRLTRKAP